MSEASAKIRITSKHLGFMIALQTRYEVRYNRVPRRWWWLSPRYEILIPVDDVLGSANDYWTRVAIITIASNKRCFNFVMEVTDGVKYERV